MAVVQSAGQKTPEAEKHFTLTIAMTQEKFVAFCAVTATPELVILETMLAYCVAL